MIELKNTFKDWKITQLFGWTEYALKMEERRKNTGKRAYIYGIHTGIDFGMVIGTEIFAPHDGTVVMVDRTDNSGRGIAISIWDTHQHIGTRYYHLSKIHVRDGQCIKTGDLIAEVGDSGMSVDGSHLHFELVRTNDEGKAIGLYNGAIDPFNKKNVKWVV